MSHAPWSIQPMSRFADQPAADAGRDPSVAARVEQLYENHEALVRSICRSLLRDRVEAEDAVQQTFLSAQRALLNGSSPRDAAAWLATIARHESLSRVRARMREPLPLEVEERASGPDAHAAAVQRHETGELRDALAQLPLQQRQAILLRELRGLSYQEVAAALSVTTSAVESLLFRARRTLQTRLGEGLASFSLGGWVQLLRERAARIAGGGLAAPAAAKVAAVGIGTAVVTGGALVGPTVLGLGHAPRAVRSASPPTSHRASHPEPAKTPVTFSATPARHPARLLADLHPQRPARVRGGGSGSQSEVSDTREKEPSTDTGETTSGDGSASTGTTREVGDGGSIRRATSPSGDDSRTGTRDDTSTGSSSGTATTSSPTRDD
jgi:RNA polymerase sigma-70 factor (ECF subfamily)